MLALLLAACAYTKENVLDHDAFKHIRGEEYKEYFYADADKFSRDTDYKYLVIDRSAKWIPQGEEKPNEEINLCRHPDFIDRYDDIEYNQRIPTGYDDLDFAAVRRRFIARGQEQLPHDVMITEDAAALLKTNRGDETDLPAFPQPSTWCKSLIFKIFCVPPRAVF